MASSWALIVCSQNWWSTNLFKIVLANVLVSNQYHCKLIQFARDRSNACNILKTNTNKTGWKLLWQIKFGGSWSSNYSNLCGSGRSVRSKVDEPSPSGHVWGLIRGFTSPLILVCIQTLCIVIIRRENLTFQIMRNSIIWWVPSLDFGGNK